MSDNAGLLSRKLGLVKDPVKLTPPPARRVVIPPPSPAVPPPPSPGLVLDEPEAIPSQPAAEFDQEIELSLHTITAGSRVKIVVDYNSYEANFEASASRNMDPDQVTKLQDYVRRKCQRQLAALMDELGVRKS